MSTASIPPEKLAMYGALAIAGYWFVTKKAGAMPRMKSSMQPGKYRLASRPPSAGDSPARYASTDGALFNTVGGIFSKLLDRTQTTVNNAKSNQDGSYTQDGIDGNAPNVYGRGELRNVEKGGGYYGGSAGDTYGGGGEGSYGRQSVRDFESGSGYYGSGNDGTVINPAPSFGSVYDAASEGNYRWDPGY